MSVYLKLIHTCYDTMDTYIQEEGEIFILISSDSVLWLADFFLFKTDSSPKSYLPIQSDEALNKTSKYIRNQVCVLIS